MRFGVSRFAFIGAIGENLFATGLNFRELFLPTPTSYPPI